jgi:hypothetical protein
MKHYRSLVFLALGASLIALAAPSAHRVTAQAAGPIAVIVASAFPQSDISLALLARVFRGEPTDYGGSRLVPFNYASENPMRLAFDKFVLKMSPDQAASYWVDRRIRGQGMSPRVVPAPAIMKAIVMKLPGAIGYVPAEQVDSSVRVLTVDGKNIKAGDYPIK